MVKTGKAKAKRKITAKEITEVLTLSPLFHELNPQDKKTLIVELRERIKELEGEVKRLRALKARDKRAYPRKEVRTLVNYALDKFFLGYVHNISEGGMFIGTKKPLPMGTKVTFAFTMPESDIPIEVKGKVIWISKKGMGLKFKEVDELTKGKIGSILSEI